MGHEFVGEVVDVGAGVTDLKPGDRVIGMAGRGCGECEACKEGHYNWCEQLKVIGGHIPGALAEEMVLPAEQFLAIPDWIPDDQATLIEVGAVGMHTINRYGDVEGKSCLVLGAGPVGLVLRGVPEGAGGRAGRGQRHQRGAARACPRQRRRHRHRSRAKRAPRTRSRRSSRAAWTWRSTAPAARRRC